MGNDRGQLTTHKEYLLERSALEWSTDSASVCDRFSRFWLPMSQRVGLIPVSTKRKSI
jgi:hypothetical protein